MIEYVEGFMQISLIEVPVVKRIKLNDRKSGYGPMPARFMGMAARNAFDIV
jgi:hypothetical protein